MTNKDYGELTRDGKMQKNVKRLVFRTYSSAENLEKNVRISVNKVIPCLIFRTEAVRLPECLFGFRSFCRQQK